MTRWSRNARRIAATVPESSSDARLMPWISAPSAPAIGLTSSAAIARSMSLEIRLLARMRFGEGRNAHASVVDAHHALVGLNWALEQLRRRHLRDEADVRDRRAVAVAEPAGGILFGEELFHCLKAGAEPMPDPCRFRGLVDLEDFLALQSLEIERDADAERRLRPPIGVDLHPIPPSLFDWC